MRQEILTTVILKNTNFDRPFMYSTKLTIFRRQTVKEMMFHSLACSKTVPRLYVLATLIARWNLQEMDRNAVDTAAVVAHA